MSEIVHNDEKEIFLDQDNFETLGAPKNHRKSHVETLTKSILEFKNEILATYFALRYTSTFFQLELYNQLYY